MVLADSFEFLVFLAQFTISRLFELGELELDFEEFAFFLFQSSFGFFQSDLEFFIFHAEFSFDLLDLGAGFTAFGQLVGDGS